MKSLKCNSFYFVSTYEGWHSRTDGIRKVIVVSCVVSDAKSTRKSCDRRSRHINNQPAKFPSKHVCNPTRSISIWRWIENKYWSFLDRRWHDFVARTGASTGKILTILATSDSKPQGSHSHILMTGGGGPSYFFWVWNSGQRWFFWVAKRKNGGIFWGLREKN